MSDILKTLDAWEAEVKQDLEFCKTFSAGDTRASRRNEQHLLLTQALRVALESLHIYESGKAMAPDMGSGGIAYFARQKIEALLNGEKK